jgi:hypothetical protein
LIGVLCSEHVYLGGDLHRVDAIWKELGRREELLRNAYRNLRIPLNPDQGLALALAEARALADGVKSSEPATEVAVLKAVEACHVIFAISESVGICHSAGLEITRQLRQMATGTANFGTPGSTKTKGIYLKDFEYELFIASSLIRRGLAPRFLDDPSDPMGEMVVDQIVIECKHPDSVGQLRSNIAKFGQELTKSGRFGMFAVAVEDAHHLGDTASFGTEDEYRQWLKAKELLDFAWGFERIVGLITTQSKVLVIGAETRISRLGTSIVFDRSELPEEAGSAAIRIAKVFNPDPTHHSTTV